MVKGVQRRVVEVDCRNHAYFERAVFFVKNEKANEQERLLQKCANRYLDAVVNLQQAKEQDMQLVSMRKKGKAGKGRKILFAAVNFSAAAALGAAVVAILK